MEASETTLAVLRFCVAQVLKGGKFPTVREICDEFGWASSSTGFAYYNRLVKLRWVTPKGRYNRCITSRGYDAAKSGSGGELCRYIVNLVRGLDKQEIAEIAESIAAVAS